MTTSTLRLRPEPFDSAGGLARGRWSTLPFDWRGIPEERLLGHETLDVIGRAIAGSLRCRPR